MSKLRCYSFDVGRNTFGPRPVTPKRTGNQRISSTQESAIFNNLELTVLNRLSSPSSQIHQSAPPISFLIFSPSKLPNMRLSWARHPRLTPRTSKQNIPQHERSARTEYQYSRISSSLLQQIILNRPFSSFQIRFPLNFKCPYQTSFNQPTSPPPPGLSRLAYQFMASSQVSLPTRSSRFSFITIP